MKDLLEYILKQLVPNPGQVEVEEDRNDSEINYLVTVAPEDMGLVIGKNGQTIKAIRRLLSVRAISDNVRVNVRLNDPQNQNDQSPTED